jgi:hypothetical protein
MTLHINRFVDKIRAVESKNQRDVTLTINEARDLHAEITKLLLKLNVMEEKMIQSLEAATDTVKVEIQGGTF